MANIQIGSRQQDARRLPIKEAQELASKLYEACYDEDAKAVNKIGHEYLKKKGYRDDSPVQFTFDIHTVYTDVELRVQCFFNIGGDAYTISRTANDNILLNDNTDEEVYRCGASLVIGLNAAIQSCLRSLLNLIVFPEEHDNYDDAFYTIGKLSV